MIKLEFLLAFSLLIYTFIKCLKYVYHTDWGFTLVNKIDALNNLSCRYFHGMGPYIKTHKIKGPAVVAANHLCAIDPFYLCATIDAPISFLMDSQFAVPGLKQFFKNISVILVNFRDKRERAKVINITANALADGKIIAIYPYGGFYFKYGKDQELQIRDGIARIILEAQELLRVRAARDSQDEQTTKAKLILEQLAQFNGKIPVYPFHIEGINTKSLGKLGTSFLRPGKIKIYPMGDGPIFINNADETRSFMTILESFLGPQAVLWDKRTHTERAPPMIMDKESSASPSSSALIL